MAVIKVDPAALREKAATLEQKISELNGMNAKLQQLIVRIGDSWEGDASTAYYNLMQSYAQQAVEMIAVLTEFKKYARNAADQFEKVDKDSASRIRSSF